MKFAKRKKDILSKSDKSSKGFVDSKISKLCEKINSSERYYTTSSCAGRIVLVIDNEKKAPGMILKSWHDLISFEELKKELESHSLPTASPTNRPHYVRSRSPIDNDNSKNLKEGVKLKTSKKVSGVKNFSAKKSGKADFEAMQTSEQGERVNSIRFKQEPCALHVVAGNLEDAQEFLDKAKLAGWKKSGIITSEKRFVLELTSTEKLEFPIIHDKKILVDDDFLKLIVEKSNFNLKRTWNKIEKLRKSIQILKNN